MPDRDRGIPKLSLVLPGSRPTGSREVTSVVRDPTVLGISSVDLTSCAGDRLSQLSHPMAIPLLLDRASAGSVLKVRTRPAVRRGRLPRWRMGKLKSKKGKPQ